MPLQLCIPVFEKDMLINIFFGLDSAPGLTSSSHERQRERERMIMAFFHLIPGFLRSWNLLGALEGVEC